MTDNCKDCAHSFENISGIVCTYGGMCHNPWGRKTAFINRKEYRIRYRILTDTKDYDMKTEQMKMKLLCEKLNAHLPCKSQEDIDALNNLIYEMRKANPDSNLYWDREIYIDANFSFEQMREIAKYSGKVQFEPSDDPMEHPGVVVRYKEEYKTGR